ncbi:MAG: HD-GYP domain-containing protein [Candidatus Aminicenantes bacterium]|nr:HD-GYP domain-containing protein [Candidatus Aminicenantes bacterium]MDH5704800.1 HD-GYP domain-containing protein [Candidatus Aminicenantes bacterium]
MEGLKVNQGSIKGTIGSYGSPLSSTVSGYNPFSVMETTELALNFPGNPDDTSGFNRQAPVEEQTEASFLSLFEMREEPEVVSFWERGFWETRKMSLARKVLVGLDQRHKSVFKDHNSGSQEEDAEKETFFNSNLLYLIAITDGNEDTLGHSQLVSRYTVLFAKELGIEDRNFLIDLERGALLHDIGKIGIPEFVLRKDGPLTRREKEVVKDHPFLGYEMIEEFDFLKKAAQVVLFHHEHYDGSGYPFGLSASDIPLGARIFALADTLDVITSDRPYKERKSFELALGEIEKCQGSQFDPQLTDAFLSIPIEKWKEIKSKSSISLPLSAVH